MQLPLSKAYEFFNGVYELEHANGKDFFWTQQHFKITIPNDISRGGVILHLHTIVTGGVNISVYDSACKKIHVIRATNSWSSHVIALDKNFDNISFTCETTAQPLNDGRDLGICINYIDFFDDINKIEQSAKPICRYLGAGLILEDDIRACCAPIGHDDNITLLEEKTFLQNAARYSENIEILHCDLQKKRKTLIKKFLDNELLSCRGCPSFVPDTESRDQINFINISIQKKCHLKCVFCAPYNTQPSINSETTLRIGRQYLAYLSANKLVEQNSEILWTGGEPTLLEKFDTLLTLFSYINTKQEILTNAVIYSQTIEKLLMSDKVKLLISLDSGTKETYFKVKQRDLFIRVTANIKKYAMASHDNVRLKYIIVPGLNDNINDIELFLQLCRDCDISSPFLLIDFNHVCSDADIDFVLEILNKHPEFDLSYMLIFSKISNEQRATLKNTISSLH